jgi:5-methylcytosine-specific restriction endonuclease McrA
VTSNLRPNYREYIQSDDWKKRRGRALWRSAHLQTPQCEICGKLGGSFKNRDSDDRHRVDNSRGLEVHHLTYTNLGNETPEDLIVLCTDNLHLVYSNFKRGVGCHERAHADPDFAREVAMKAAVRKP